MKLLIIFIFTLLGIIFLSYFNYMKVTKHITVTVHNEQNKIRIPNEIVKGNDCEALEKWITNKFHPHPVENYKCPFVSDIKLDQVKFNINNEIFKIDHDLINEDGDIPPGSDNFFVKLQVSYPDFKPVKNTPKQDQLAIKLSSTYFYSVCRKDKTRCADLWEDEFIAKIDLDEREYKNKETGNPTLSKREVIAKDLYKNYDIYLLTVKDTEKDVITQQVTEKLERNFFIKGAVDEPIYWIWCENYEKETESKPGNCKSFYNLNDKIIVEYQFHPKYLAKHIEIRTIIDNNIKKMQ